MNWDTCYTLMEEFYLYLLYEYLSILLDDIEYVFNNELFSNTVVPHFNQGVRNLLNE